MLSPSDDCKAHLVNRLPVPHLARPAVPQLHRTPQHRLGTGKLPRILVGIAIYARRTGRTKLGAAALIAIVVSLGLVVSFSSFPKRNGWQPAMTYQFYGTATHLTVPGGCQLAVGRR